MNKERLLKLADVIEGVKDPTIVNGDKVGFNIGTYISRAVIGDLYDYNAHKCHTTACIAGWDELVYQQERGVDIGSATNYEVSKWEAEAGRNARRRLGLRETVAEYLFLNGISFDPTPSEAAAAVRALANDGSFRWQDICKRRQPSVGKGGFASTEERDDAWKWLLHRDEDAAREAFSNDFDSDYEDDNGSNDDAF